MNRPSEPKHDPAFEASLIEALGSRAISPAEMPQFVDALMTRYPSALRCRREFAPEQIGFPTRPIDWYELGRASLDREVRPSRMLEYAGGEYFLQDAGSMLALACCEAADPPTQDRLVCDLCAAPGGKASALLESIGSGFLLANEPIKSRVPPLAYNLARTGSDRYTISSLDPDQLAKQLPGVFDLVLVDAPCSGQALLGRGKQSLAAVSKTQVEHSAMRARRILASAIELVRPGGQLVLSTCTFAEAENESQVRWMLEQNGVTSDPTVQLESYGSGESECTYRLWPHLHQCAGSFAASLRCDRPTDRATKKQKRGRKTDPLPPDLSQWFDSLPIRHKVAGAVIWAWPDNAPLWAESIACRGPELAYRTGRTWKPSHEASLRRANRAASGTDAARVIMPTQSVDVDDEAAKHFISGQPVDCDASGWCVVRHTGRPLGWVKASHGTGKNHLPTAARMNLQS